MLQQIQAVAFPIRQRLATSRCAIYSEGMKEHYYSCSIDNSIDTTHVGYIVWAVLPVLVLVLAPEDGEFKTSPTSLQRQVLTRADTARIRIVLDLVLGPSRILQV